MPAQFTILVVDDDPNVVDILRRAATQCFEQAQFILIQNFEQAAAYLEGLRGSGPRLVLLDINLQSIHTGLDFLTRLRQHPQGHLIPVIILSASLNIVNREQAYQQGVNALTDKPQSYEGWKNYVSQLRAYWFETVTLPRIWFEAGPGASDEEPPS